MKASIVVINYNDRLRIQRAIDSALNQTWKDTEVIVVDDGSDKETRKIYKQFKSRIKFLQLERGDRAVRSPSMARNAGIGAATGDFISFLDSDNYIENTFVEEMMKKDTDVCFCDWEIVGKQSYAVNISNVWDMNLIASSGGVGILQNYIQFTHLDHQCLLIRKKYLDKIGVYDLRLPRSQDCDMIVRLILGGGEWSYVPKKLFVFEKHEDDQMKVYASIHGKTLWSLKNNINIRWLFQVVQNDPMRIMAFLKAIEDFRTLPEWKAAFDVSDFSKVWDDTVSIIKNEKKEKCT